MKTHIYKTRVRYAEVDQMGVVYYGNYLAYLESARTGLLRDEGYSYAEMEKAGLFLPVVECNIKYKGSARYDDEILVETTIGYIRHASIEFKYTVRAPNGNAIVIARTVHPIVDRDWKIKSVPERIRALLSPFIEN